jgi:hypothetical protein
VEQEGLMSGVVFCVGSKLQPTQKVSKSAGQTYIDNRLTVINKHIVGNSRFMMMMSKTSLFVDDIFLFYGTD